MSARIYKFWTLMATLVLGVASCQRSDVDEIIPGEEGELSPLTINASIEGQTQTTRIAFEEDSETNRIKLGWEEGDTFTIYDVASGKRCCDYTCTNAEEGTFVTYDMVLLNIGDDYIALYPATTEATLTEARNRDLTSVQSGDEINNLDAACVMEAEFIIEAYSSPSIVFEHQKAIMTFNFEVASSTKVSQLIFENGEESYTVNLEYEESFEFASADPVSYATFEDIVVVINSSYTAYIMINPCQAVERTLRFRIYDDGGELIQAKAVTSSKAYLAGYRYTAEISECASVGIGTKEDPYLISSAEDMWDFAAASQSDSFEGKYFLLTQDIDLGCTADNQWEPIGNGSYYFCGYFNGGGHVISGFYINNDDDSYQALFYSNRGVIANLGIDDSYIYCHFSAAAFAYGNSGTIVNCWSSASVSVYTSGCFAYSNVGIINNCYNVGNSYWGVVYFNDYNSDTWIPGIIKNIYLLEGSYSEGHINSQNATIENIVDKSESDMTSRGLVALLNEGATEYNSGDDVVIEACAWVYNEGGYPQFDGEAKPIALSGEGTYESPYLIGSEAELVHLSGLATTKGFEGEYVKQTADITLTEEWTPIGSASCFFEGNYDGDGYSISGLRINNSNEFQGLFGVVAWGASISNVGIKSGEINCTNGCTGAIAGENHGTIYSCYNVIDVTGTINVGGIAGQNYGTIEACYNRGAITTTGSYAGGIVGYNNGYGGGGKVNSTYNMGEVSGSYAYGVAGGSTGTVSTSYTIGTVLYYDCSYNATVITGSSYTSLAAFKSYDFCAALNSALATEAWKYFFIYSYPQLISNIESSGAI